MNRWFVITIISISTCLYPGLLRSQQIKIVTSTSIFSDMISSVGKSLVDVTSIVPVGADPHGYEPTPGDIKLMSEADIIMINGLDLEIWINKVIKNINFPNENLIIITKGIQPLTSKDYQNSKDPHAWMTAQNGLIYIENIYRAILNNISDSQKSILEDNYANYKNKLTETEVFIKETLNKIPSKNRKLVTAHDAFQYFGKTYNIDLYPLQGISPESDILIKDFQNTIRLIKNYGIPAVFVESTINPKTLQNLSEEAGCAIGGKLYADSLSDSLGGAPDYLSMLLNNTTTIANGLIAVNPQNSKHHSSNKTILLYSLVLIIMMLSLYLMIKSISK